MTSASHFTSRLKRLIDSNDLAWMPPLPPWAGLRDRQVRTIRRTAHEVLRRRLIAERGWLHVIVRSLLWPLMAGVKAGRAVPRPSISQLLHRWWLQVGHNLRIADQQDFRMEQPAQRRRARRFITDGENKALMEFLTRDAQPERVRDKIPFARFCAAHGLPTVASIAESDGDKAPARWMGRLPADDLFLKPAALWGGQGACLLRYVGAGAWRDDDGTPLTARTLARYADRRLAGLSWVLQPRLRNGPAWAAFSPAALCTVRVVTGRARADSPVEVIGGFMRFPRVDAIVDNLGAGGLGADYDRHGRLGRARSLDPATSWCDHHPDTGARITGAFIPAWDRVVSLARRAHTPITDIALIGWDVACPDDSPVLVEGNTNWGVLLDTPLGDTRYVEIVLSADHPVG